MIRLNKYYIASVYQGASGAQTSRSGFVPQAKSTDQVKFLRGDGSWQTVNTDLGEIPALSSSWSTAYTNLVSNSAAYLSGGVSDWKSIGRILFVQNLSAVELNANQYDIFVVTVDQPTEFTYSNFVSGQTIHVYLSAAHEGHIGHTFPPGTLFSELGDFNTIFTFNEYITRIMLQSIGSNVINFSSIVRVLSSTGGGGSGSGGSYYLGAGGNDGIGSGIGLNLLDEFLQILETLGL